MRIRKQLDQIMELVRWADGRPAIERPEMLSLVEGEELFAIDWLFFVDSTSP
ncbi:MAG: hypothetical protein IJR14_06660 [Synergistaceae bacterium]|nr:hypothetical protein [Synergistaceae bacterium]